MNFIKNIINKLIINFFKLKKFAKIIINLLNRFLKIILFLPSFLLIIFLRLNFKKNRKKLIGLRLTRKYLGHLAIESAMASAFQNIEKDKIIVTSFKPSKGIDNYYMNLIHRSTFQLSNDFFLIFLNFFYYNSIYFVKRKIKKYYEPFIDKNNHEREIKYIDYLDSSVEFPWRSVGRNLIFSNRNNSRNIFIAMRTSYYNEKKIGVNSQPWRDASIQDIHKIIEAANEINGEEKIFCYTNKKVWNEIIKMGVNHAKTIFLDEDNSDIFYYLNKDSLLINNGNGIGAASLALGIKTLYLHHTVWHFWHTSHGNSLAYPCEFRNSRNKNNDLKNMIKLAFLPKSIPYDFEKNFYSKGVIHNKISDLDNKDICNSIIETFNVKPLSKRKVENYLGVDFYYSYPEEKYFWELFIKSQPNKMRKFRRRISLNISPGFLKTYV